MSSSRFKVLPVHKKIIEALDEEDALIIHPFEYNYKAIYQGLAMAIHSYLINDDSDEQPQILILDSSRTKLEHITQVFEQLIIEFKIVTLFNENDINQSFDLLCDYNDPPRIVISSPGTINNLIKYHTNCIDNFIKSCLNVGVDGLIIVDLQPEEDSELLEKIQSKNIAMKPNQLLLLKFCLILMMK